MPKAQHYKSSPQLQQQVLDRVNKLMALGGECADDPLRDRINVPKPVTDMRITPKP